MNEASVAFRGCFHVSRRRRLIIVCVAFVLVGFFSLLDCSAQEVTPSSGGSCNGTYTGTFRGNVTISIGQSCNFTAGGITGNVRINGGRLFLNNATVRGNVQVTRDGNLALTNSRVLGNVEFDEGGTFSIGPAVSIEGNLHIHELPPTARENRICGVTVSGNVELQKNGTAVLMGAATMCPGNAIRGNLEVENNTGAATLFNNTVGRNAQVRENSSPILVIGNRIGGNLQIENNLASVIVAFNNVERDLGCENNPVISGGSNLAREDRGCPLTLQASAFAVSNGTSVVFKSPAGNTVLTVPLINQTVPQGNATSVTHERARISDDASHAGIYTISFVADPADGATEAVVTGTFRYFDSTGQLWQITAPLGTDFFLPVDPSQRLFTPDGSRVLVISTDEGSTNPAFTVYDKTGAVVYQSSGVFLELYEAQISPTGQNLMIMGIVKSNGTYGSLIRVTDINNNVSSDFQFDITKGRPVISTSSDGRFQISYQGSQVVLP